MHIHYINMGSVRNVQNQIVKKKQKSQNPKMLKIKKSQPKLMTKCQKVHRSNGVGGW